MLRKLNSRFLLIVSLLICTQSLWSQTTLIPDPNFEQALINQGIDSGPIDGQVTTANITFVGMLIINNQNISDLTGIEGFTSLFHLNCSWNNLTSLDVSSNTQLTYLNFYQNSIGGALDLTQNSLLEILEADWNNLTSVNVTQCASLISLDCSVNSLSSIDLTQNTNLISLNCSDNDILSLDVSQNPSLDFLSCGNNNLSALDVTQNTLLTTLGCGGNPIGTINVTMCSILESFSCPVNNLTTLNVTQNPLLNYFVCYMNSLSSLDVTQNPNLYTFYCHTNNLTSLDLSQNVALVNLYCDLNQLSSLDVSSCSSLFNLSCRDNNLTYLDVSQNSALDDLNCANNEIFSLDVSQNINLTELYCRNNQLECLRIGDPTQYNTAQTATNFQVNPNLLCIETTDPAYAAINLTYHDFQSVYGQYCLCDVGPNKIIGTVELDNIIDCIGEQPLQNVIVQSDAGNFDITNSLGEYGIFGDAGTVVITQLPINSPNFIQQTCPNFPTTYTTSVIGSGNVVSGFDFRDELIACPTLSIGVVNNYLMCFQNQGTINYCNDGWIDTNNVSVFLELPPYMSLLSASSPYTITPEGFYEFTIGTLNAGDCGQITFIDSVHCDPANMGDVQCTYAWIIPGNSCLYNNSQQPWDSSEVQVYGNCLNDSLVKFVIENVSSFDMIDYTEYRIYEGGVLSFVDSIQIMAGDSIVMIIPSIDQEYRIEVDQILGYPSVSDPNFVIQSCFVGSGGASEYVSIRPNLDGDIAIDNHCGSIIGSYDPNIKEFEPSAIGSNNNIAPGTSIDYTIHFQNTGSAPAINIVVADTVSPNLDLSTFQFLGSSDPVVIDIIGDTIPVLKFTFYNINLPDSSVDYLGSQGFVQFSLSPYSNLPLGTEIHNDADIYFDYNEPITTNDAWYTIYDTLLQQLPVINPVDAEVYCSDTTLYLDSFYLTTFVLEDLIQSSSGDVLQIDFSNYQDTLSCFDTGINNYTITAFGYNNSSSCISQVTVIDSSNYIDTIISCDSYTWMDGITYTTSNNLATYTLLNTLGCDSIITLDLLINNSTGSTDVITACDSYIWIDGNMYTSSNNTATIVYTSVAGCDSLITLDLTMNSSAYSAPINVSSCDTYISPSGNYNWSTSGLYYDTILTVNGCDSVIPINLTIESMDLTVLNISNTLVSMQSNADYQWMNCANNVLISGETNQTFIPSTGGDYAVIVTYNNCMDTSECTASFVSVFENMPDELIKLYPNPTKGSFTIELGELCSKVDVEVTNSLGQIISNKSFTDLQKVEMNLKGEPGVYFVQITIDEGKTTIPLIKQ